MVTTMPETFDMFNGDTLNCLIVKRTNLSAEISPCPKLLQFDHSGLLKYLDIRTSKPQIIFGTEEKHLRICRSENKASNSELTISKFEF